MKSRIMILGAGRDQVPLIIDAKDYGLETVVVSCDGNYPGFDIADHCYKVDIKDKNTVLSIAENEDLIAIYSPLEMGVPTAAYVSDKLGLPSIGYDTAVKFTNKYVMRKEAAQIGINIPEYSTATSLNEAMDVSNKIGFPLIIKPVDNSASRGVYKVNNCEEMKSMFPKSIKYSTVGRVLIERFIYGQEFCVNGFAYDYDYMNLVIGEIDNYDLQNKFIARSSVFIDARSCNDTVEKRILNINSHIVKNFKLKYGITYAEYIYEELTDKIYLVEIAAISGGMFITSDLIPLATGVNVHKYLFDYFSGKTINSSLNSGKGASAYYSFLAPPGVIVNTRNNIDNIKNITGVYGIHLDGIYNGRVLGELKDKSSRLGPVLVYGNNREECYRIIEEVKRELIIEVKTQNGIENIYW